MKPIMRYLRDGELAMNKDEVKKATHYCLIEEILYRKSPSISEVFRK